MERYPLAIVIPAYNEDATIQNVVREAQRFGHVIVVDDAGTDMTAEKARTAGAEVLTNEQNQGYDGSLAAGLNHAMNSGFEYALSMDADGQHAALDILKFLKALDQGADVVIGVRPKPARLGEALFRIFGIRLWGIRDPLCGMKAYRLDCVRKYGSVDLQNSIGTGLAAAMIQDGKKLVQFPICLNKRRDQPRFGGQLSANIRIISALCKAIKEHFISKYVNYPIEGSLIKAKKTLKKN